MCYAPTTTPATKLTHFISRWARARKLDKEEKRLILYWTRRKKGEEENKDAYSLWEDDQRDMRLHHPFHELDGQGSRWASRGKENQTFCSFWN